MRLCNIGGCVQDTYDEQTGRKVRRARQVAATAIAEHAKWVAHNPYRMAEAGEGAAAGGGSATNGAAAAENGGVTEDKDDAVDWEVQPSRSQTGGGHGAANVAAGIVADKRTKSQTSFRRAAGEDGDDDDGFADGTLLACLYSTVTVSARV